MGSPTASFVRFVLFRRYPVIESGRSSLSCPGKALKMSLIRAALRSNSTVSALQRSHGLPFLLRESPRLFSTDAEQPPQNSASDPFLQTPRSGLTYGRLLGIRNYTLKTDVINLLEGSNLTLDDVKVDYDRSFNPLAMMLQFRSQNYYDHAIRVIAKKGRLYQMERADRGQWDLVTPYDGRTILMQGLPRFAPAEDIERFLYGCDYDQSSLNIFLRQGISEPLKFATVRFPSKTEAMNAFITKNGSFCQNSKVLIRVLQ